MTNTRPRGLRIWYRSKLEKVRRELEASWKAAGSKLETVGRESEAKWKERWKYVDVSESTGRRDAEG
jgi:hypothetical protein